MDQTKTLITAEQLLGMGGSRRLELVRGELVEMSPVGEKHARMVMSLGWLLRFVEERKLGAVGTEWGFILSRNPDIVRAPDIAFVAAARLGWRDPEGYFEGAPDLVIEVTSPGDTHREVQEKVSEYLAAGARLVLVVDSQTQKVTAYRPSGEAHLYSANDVVTGEDVLPGFSFRPADLLRLD